MRQQDWTMMRDFFVNSYALWGIFAACVVLCVFIYSPLVEKDDQRWWVRGSALLVVCAGMAYTTCAAITMFQLWTAR